MSKSAHELIRVMSRALCLRTTVRQLRVVGFVVAESPRASARVRAGVVKCRCPFFLLAHAAALSIRALISIVYEM